MVTESVTFARTEAGDPVRSLVLSGGGLRATVLTWGATLQSLTLDGQDFSVILGSPHFAAYRNDLRYFGAIVGPVANRISGGRVTLDGRSYDLDRNERGVTTLHGGAQGFGERNWSLLDHGDDFVTLGLTQPDLLCGFPGAMEVRTTYRLLAQRVLEIEITGESRSAAFFNPAFHGYWNLDGSADILNHRLTVAADRFLPVDDLLLPLGDAAPVAGTAFDYRKPGPVAGDLDHNFCTGDARCALRYVASLEGRLGRLDIETTEPGLQVYSAGHTASGGWPGHDGRPFGRNAGLAFEPQLWPDAPNNPGFPSARMEPGQRVTQISRFRLTC